jgi:hypothetical protein
MTAIETLKQWFSNLKKPTQEQFWAWLDSFWHKSEKIPMASVEGLDKLVEGTASAEQLSNHLNDTQAHKVLFDKKVDKVEGKELSSNDYTDEEKARNTENEKWRAVGMSVTGEANKTITLTFKNGEVLTAPFADIAGGGGAGPDVKLNSLEFDPTTGVLTGNRSDGTPITVNLDGRYALLEHKHTIYDITGLNNSLDAHKREIDSLQKFKNYTNGFALKAGGQEKRIYITSDKNDPSVMRTINLKSSEEITVSSTIEEITLPGLGIDPNYTEKQFNIVLNLSEDVKNKLNNSGGGSGTDLTGVVRYGEEGEISNTAGKQLTLKSNLGVIELKNNLIELGELKNNLQPRLDMESFSQVARLKLHTLLNGSISSETKTILIANAFCIVDKDGFREYELLTPDTLQQKYTDSSNCTKAESGKTYTLEGGEIHIPIFCSDENKNSQFNFVITKESAVHFYLNDATEIIYARGIEEFKGVGSAAKIIIDSEKRAIVIINNIA